MPVPLRRRLAAILTILIAGTALVVGSADSPATTSKPPAHVSAKLIAPDRAPYAPAGTIVKQATLGHRAFADAVHGFALATLTSHAYGGATYPATSTDGGVSWRIDGPHFHTDAADAPDVVTGVGVGGRRTFFAFAGPGGGQALDVTTDAGRHWYRAFLPAPPLAVVHSSLPRGGELIAFLQGSPTWVYVSRDGGRHWTYTTSPAV